MIRAVWLLALLAGCAAPPGGSGPAAEACRQKAYQDPAVSDAIMRSNSQMQEARGPALIELDALLRRKTRDCLAGEGLGSRGGVQAVQPY